MQFYVILFKLFKYIFFRDLLYTIIYRILIYIMIWGLININILVSGNVFHIPLIIISILFGSAILLHVLKLILKQVIFSKYDKIQINTTLKEISWSFFLKMSIPRILATTVMNLIYWGICILILGNYNDTVDMIGLI